VLSKFWIGKKWWQGKHGYADAEGKYIFAFVSNGFTRLTRRGAH
jgi:hypothetical protein